jgi:hypothetical protein
VLLWAYVAVCLGIAAWSFIADGRLPHHTVRDRILSAIAAAIFWPIGFLVVGIDTLLHRIRG